MTQKTYTRARAAVAALRKLLIDAHEVPTDHFQIVTEEVEDGRHTAKVDFLVAQPPFVLMDLQEQGWTFTDPDAKTDGTIISWTPGADVLADAKKALADYLPAVSDAVETPVATTTALVPKPSGYVKETSSIQNATKMVWAIADAMPGAQRKDVIEACRARGIAYGTARTQYQHWKKAQKA